MDDDRAAQARAVFARIRKGPSRMTSIPQIRISDCTELLASDRSGDSESTAPLSSETPPESISDTLTPSDGAADSKMYMERSDSGIGRPPPPLPGSNRTLVLEPQVAIQPRDSCIYQHRKHYKDTANHVPVHLLTHDSLSYTYQSQTCRYTDCYESHFEPSEAKPERYRMSTNDKLEDLKRWLTTPNARHDGKTTDRQLQAEWLGSNTFTNTNLRDALFYGIKKVKESRVEVNSLADYFSEHYNLRFRDFMRDAHGLETFPSLMEIGKMSRPDLVYEMVRTATQLDLSREETERVTRGIAKRKWELACKGDDFEMRELMRLEYIQLEPEGSRDEGVLRLG